MSDQGGGATPPAGQGDPGAGTPPPAPPAPAPTGQPPGDLGEAGKRALEAEREARKTAEARAKELEGKLKTHEEALLPESDRTLKRLAEAEEEKHALQLQLQEHRIQTAFSAAATKAGALYPDDLWKVADLSQVDYDDSGTPKNLDKLIEAIRKDRPGYFRGVGSADGGARQTAGGSADMNQLIRRKAGIT